MTTGQFVVELNRFPVVEVTRVFKVSEAAVEGWKRGEMWEPDWYRDTLTRILNEKGTPA